MKNRRRCLCALLGALVVPGLLPMVAQAGDVLNPVLIPGADGQDDFESYTLNTPAYPTTSTATDVSRPLYEPGGVIPAWDDCNSTRGNSNNWNAQARRMKFFQVQTATQGGNDDNQALRVACWSTANVPSFTARTNFWNTGTDADPDVSLDGPSVFSFDIELNCFATIGTTSVDSTTYRGAALLSLTGGRGYSGWMHSVAAVGFGGPGTGGSGGATGGNILLDNWLGNATGTTANSMNLYVAAGGDYSVAGNKPQWIDTGVSYGLNTVGPTGDLWYTLMIELSDNVDRVYNVLFGPRGGPLTVIASNVPWVGPKPADEANGYIDSVPGVGGMMFKTGGNSLRGDYFIDNVYAAPVPEPSSLLALLGATSALVVGIRRRRG